MNFFTTTLIIFIALSFFSPRLMTQALPYILFIIILLKFNNRSFYKVPEHLKNFIIPSIVISLLSLILNNFFLFNYLIGWYTFFSGFIIMIIGYSIYNSLNIKKISIAYILICVIQVIIGTIQVGNEVGYSKLLEPTIIFGSGTGDFFTGTYFAPLKSSQILTYKIILGVFLLIYMGEEIGFYNKFIKLILTFILVFGIFLGDNNHLTISFLLSIITYHLYINFFIQKKIINFLKILILIFLGLLALINLKGKIGSIDYSILLINKVFSINTLNYYEYEIVPRKILATYETIFVLPQFSLLNPFIGVGAGMYSSYAAQVGNWDIIQQNIFQLDYPKEFWEIIYKKWNLFLLSKPFKDGNANMPWFTYMSVLGEYGYIVLILFIIFWRKNIMYLKYNLNDNSRFVSGLSKFLLISTFFMLYTFFFDNYLEDPRITMLYFLYLGYFLGIKYNFHKY